MASELLTENSKQCHVFQDLMLVLTTLANAGSGIGHVQLFRACAEWMRKGHSEFFSKSDDKEDVIIDNACKILEYMCDVIAALKLSTEHEDGARFRSSSPTAEASGMDNDIIFFLTFFLRLVFEYSISSNGFLGN